MSKDPDSAKVGSLTIVGTGIRIMSQMTNEAIAQIRIADRVPFIGYDPMMAGIIQSLNPAGAEDMTGEFEVGRIRALSIAGMTERILQPVREGFRTCAALFGHPGCLVISAHNAIRRARQEGFEARMLPGISAEDCLFAELGIDPGSHGCLSFEALDFLVNNRQIDPRCHVILWQIGIMGDPVHRPANPNLTALPVLVEQLCNIYPADHEVIIYESAVSLFGESYICRTPLNQLDPSKLTTCATLCIPPAVETTPEPDIVRKLKAVGFPIEDRLKAWEQLKADGGCDVRS